MKYIHILYLSLLGLVITSCDKLLHYSMDNKVLPIHKDGKYGFIDPLGNLLIDYRYFEPIEFHYGPIEFYDEYAIVKEDSKYGIIDMHGDFVLEPRYSEIHYIARYPNYFTKLEVSNFEIMDDSIRYIFCANTRELIKTSFHHFRYWKNQKFIAENDSNNDGVVGFYGDTIVPFKYREIEALDSNSVNHEPLHIFRKKINMDYAITEKNGKDGIIHISGREIVPTKYDNIGSFVDNLAFVINNNKIGVIDTSGKEIIECKYDNIQGDRNLSYSSLRNGFFLTSIGNNPIKARLGDYWGYINLKGETVIDFEFEEGHTFYDGITSVKKNGKWGVIDSLGKTIIPFIYDDAGSPAENRVPVKINDKWGLIDLYGKIILPFEYDYIRFRVDNRYPYLETKVVVHKKNIGKVFDVKKDVFFTQESTGIDFWPCYYLNYSDKGINYLYFDSHNQPGLVDLEGNLIIDPKDDFKKIYTWHIDEGFLILSKKDSSDRYYNQIYDLEENRLLKNRYLEARYEGNGVIKVELFDSTMGYINTKGKWIWKPE